MRLKRVFFAVWLGAVLVSAEGLAGGLARAADAGVVKQIPISVIPPKTIPGEVRRSQAAAFDARQRKNRALVRASRREKGRQLKRTGTAYEKDPR